MTRKLEKDLGAIADRYAFFESDATEADTDLRAYATRLAGPQPDGER